MARYGLSRMFHWMNEKKNHAFKNSAQVYGLADKESCLSEKKIFVDGPLMDNIGKAGQRIDWLPYEMLRSSSTGISLIGTTDLSDPLFHLIQLDRFPNWPCLCSICLRRIKTR